MNFKNNYIWGLICFIGLWTNSVLAADEVVIQSGNKSISIPVEELQALVKADQLSGDLQQILNSEQKDLIIKGLKTNFKFPVSLISYFLDTAIGESFISYLKLVIPDASAANLKIAVVKNSNNPTTGFSLMDLIASYPESKLNINLNELVKIRSKFNQNFWETQAFMSALLPKLVTDKPNLSFPIDLSQSGQGKVKIEMLELVDNQRARKISVHVYSSDKINPSYPIFVFTHGLGSVNQELRYLAEHLASHGFLVAIPEHPGSNGDFVKRRLLRNLITKETDLIDPDEFLHRPRDISFVLDKLGFKEVVILGYSLGGSTALSLAGAQLELSELKKFCMGENPLALSLGENVQCIAKGLPGDLYQLRDNRVVGAIALSPTASIIFGQGGLSNVKIPTLILASSADKTTPALTEQIVPFEQISAPKWLVGVVGGTHLSVKDPSTTLDQAGQPNTWYSGGEVVGDQSIEVRNYLKAIVTAFGLSFTPQSEKSAVFLSSDYARLISNDRFLFRIVTEIPPEIKNIINQFK